ncbi:hypothetical protein V1264_019426 [Littorina saxatilis]|uniref:Uncharacterized protein n=1 Tax=Littorina saxatilis TaxID=31220 RepID=A0AAN9GDX4_9CAEN
MDVKGGVVTKQHRIIGYIVLAYAIVIYLISAVKAIRDRRMIKARIAAKQSGKGGEKTNSGKRGLAIFVELAKKERIKNQPPDGSLGNTHNAKDDPQPQLGPKASMSFEMHTPVRLYSTSVDLYNRDSKMKTGIGVVD